MILELNMNTVSAMIVLLIYLICLVKVILVVILVTELLGLNIHGIHKKL